MVPSSRMRFSLILFSALNLLSSQAYICHLCRDEGFPGKPNGGVVILQEVVPLPKPLYTCEELYYLGLEGGIIEKYCLPLVATVKEHCECAEFNTGPPDNTWTASTPTGNTWSWDVPWSSWDLPTPSSGVPPSPTVPFDLPVSFPTEAPMKYPVLSPTMPIQAPTNPPAPAPQTWPVFHPWSPIAWTLPIQAPQSIPAPAPQTGTGTNPWNPTAWTIDSPVPAPSNPSPPGAPSSWPVQNYVSTTWDQATLDNSFTWQSGWGPMPTTVVQAPTLNEVAGDISSESSKGMSMKMKGMSGSKRALRGNSIRK